MQRIRGFDPIDFVLNFFLIGIGLLVLSPLIICIINSFNSAAAGIFPPEGFSLHWYENALFNIGPMSPAPQFSKGLRVSLIVAVGATILALVIGTPASRALVRYDFFGKEALRSFFTAPLIVPRVVFGAALFLLYIRIDLYGSIFSLIMAHALLGLPFVIVLLSATLHGVDPATEEAAMDLGANPLQSLLLVTLPQMRVGLIVSALFVFITSFDDVDVSIFVTRPRNFTLPVYMFNYSLDHQNPTLAAVSSLLIAFSALLVFIAVLLLRTTEYRKFLERK